MPEKWAWLCGFPPRELRSCDVWVNTGGGGSRPSALALAHLRAAGCSDEGGSGFAVIGLVLLKPRDTWDGPLTAWPPGAQAQQCYWNQPRDSYRVAVLRAIRLAEPVAIHTHQAGGKEALIELRTSCMVC